jgi:hypothetical protein
MMPARPVTKYIARVFFIFALLFFSSWSAAEMFVITKDGKKFTLPVKGGDVKRIEFVDGGYTGAGGGAGGAMNNRYKAVLTQEGITWEEAKVAAQAMGGHLATVRNAAENEYIYSLVSNDDRYWFVDGYGSSLGPWLGGYQPDGSPEPGGGWKWITGEPFSYTNWGSGQPDNFAGEDRLQFYGARKTKSSKWNDIARNFKARGYIVEFESGQTGGGATSEQGIESFLFRLHSIAPVYNNPPKNTVFSLNKTSRITKIYTYHWNNGKGDVPGTIGLRNLDTGEVLGIWNVIGRYSMFDSTPGAVWPLQGDGPPYLYWTVQPNVVAPPGTYQVVDSNTATWSTNWEMDNMGCVGVYGMEF